MPPEKLPKNALKPNTPGNGNLISPRRTVSNDPWISPRGAGPLLKKPIDQQNTRLNDGFFSREKLNRNFNDNLPSQFNDNFSKDPLWRETVQTLLPFYQHAIEELRSKNINDYISYLTQMAEIIFDCLFSIYENLEKKENPQKNFDRKKHLPLFITTYPIYCKEIMKDVHQQKKINSKNWFNYLNRNDLMLRQEIDIFINNKKMEAMQELMEAVNPSCYIKDYKEKNNNFRKKISASISISSALNEQREKNKNKEIRAQYYLLDGIANSILPLIEIKKCSLCITDNIRKIASQLKEHSHILHLNKKTQKWRLYNCIEISKIKELPTEEWENIAALIQEKNVEEVNSNKEKIEEALVEQIESNESLKNKNQISAQINNAILKTADPDIQLIETKNKASSQLKKIAKRLDKENYGCFSWFYRSTNNKKKIILQLKSDINSATSSDEIINLLTTCLTNQVIKKHRHRITGLAQGIFNISTSTESELKAIKINLLKQINKYKSKEKLLEISEGLFKVCNPSPNQSPYSEQQNSLSNTKQASKKFGELYSVPEEEEINANLIQHSASLFATDPPRHSQTDDSQSKQKALPTPRPH